MKQVFKIDDQGFYIEPVMVNDDEELAANLIETPIPEGLFNPKWSGFEWVEGMSQEEIDALKRQQEEKEKATQYKQYLAETDWYVMRKLETGQEIPQEIAAKRQEAIDFLSNYNGDSI